MRAMRGWYADDLGFEGFSRESIQDLQDLGHHARAYTSNGEIDIREEKLRGNLCKAADAPGYPHVWRHRCEDSTDGRRG